MIKLTRIDIPNEISTQLAQRATRLKVLLDSGSDPPPSLLEAYRDPALKSHLVAEAHGKCIYCESKVTHVYFGDIEHIKPKSKFPYDRLEPDNLGLACAVCNNAKGNFWNDDAPLLNPYYDDPGAELIALGFFITQRPGRNRARLSVATLELNRPALLERRKERIELLQPLADLYALEPPGPTKDLFLRELRRQAEDWGEYAMIVRAFLESACEVHHGS